MAEKIKFPHSKEHLNLVVSRGIGAGAIILDGQSKPTVPTNTLFLEENPLDTANMPVPPTTNDPTPVSSRPNLNLVSGDSNPEYAPKNVDFSLNPNLIQFLQGYHGFMMFEGHTSHSIEEDIYFAIDNYPIDIDPQEQQGLLDIQQTTSTSEQNFSVKLSPERIAKIAIVATNLKCDLSVALSLMITHLKEERQNDPKTVKRITEALTRLSKGPFTPPSIN